MKKAIVALFVFGSTALADYTWNGGDEITSEKWANAANWTLDEGVVFGGNGPGTAGSDMWGSIYVSSASGSVGNENDFMLEGWELDLTLTNGANLTFQRVKKFQGGTNISIDATSSLTFYSYYGGNDGHRINLNNKGSFTLGYSLRAQGGEGFFMNLYDTGVVNLIAQNTGGVNTAKVASITAQLTGAATGIQERTLISLGNGISFDDTVITYAFTDANGAAMTAVDSLEALSTATVPSYFVTKDNAGIRVSYTSSVPEPTTAALSLLSLAGLAARRRRKQ